MQDPKPTFCQELPSALPQRQYLSQYGMIRTSHSYPKFIAHPYHIHPHLCLRDMYANNRITEEDQSRGNEMPPPPFAHFIQTPHHK